VLSKIVGQSIPFVGLFGLTGCAERQERRSRCSARPGAFILMEAVRNNQYVRASESSLDENAKGILKDVFHAWKSTSIINVILTQRIDVDINMMRTLVQDRFSRLHQCLRNLDSRTPFQSSKFLLVIDEAQALGDDTWGTFVSSLAPHWIVEQASASARWIGSWMRLGSYRSAR